MSMRTTPVLVVLAFVGLLSGGCATAEEATLDGRYSLTIVTENEHRFGAGEVSVGPLVIAGGITALEQGAEHHGTVAVLAGELTLDGTVRGDLLALGGNVRMGESGLVTGDIQQGGGALARAEGSTVHGSVVERTDPASLVGQPASDTSVLERVVWVAITGAVMAALAWTLVRLAPRPAGRVQTAATIHPVVSGALGTLVLLTAPAVLLSMVFTLVLIPLAIALVLPFAAVVAYGVLGLGFGIGTRIAAKSGWDLPAPAAAAVGTGLLVVGLNIVSSAPVLGLLLLFAVGAAGTGAVLLTALGTRSYVAPADP